MNNTFWPNLVRFRGLLIVPLALGLLGCQPEPETHWQGYLEGEYIYVGASLGGRLETLSVQRGDTVEAGDTLFRLETTLEAAALREAEDRLAQVNARLADLRKGQRPVELAAVQARLDQAHSSWALSKLELDRITALLTNDAVAAEVLDRARYAFERDESRVHELQAQLKTARLGARVDVLAGAEAEVSAAEAVVRQAQWRVQEKTPVATAGALVFDILYREGEVVAAGQPVVQLLPPAQLKVRFFVPEPVRATLAVGDEVEISMSGESEPKRARIVYLSPAAEFTPPVLYNRDNRAKLVFMIEAVFASDAGVELRPGQPVEVSR